MSKLEIFVTADTNDADYITSNREITKEEFDKFKPLFDAINKIGGKFYGENNFVRNHNWFSHECQDKTPSELYENLADLAMEFDHFVPYGECGVHTITSITLKETKVISEPLK